MKTVVELVDSAVERHAGRWFRPPHAQGEMAFLLACTRCDLCIQACPYGILFPLPLAQGVQVVGTPAMDLSTQGCHLCSDWPCVRVCEPGALRLPRVADGVVPPLPRLATITLDPARCLPYQGPECGACGSVCPVPGALAWEGPRPISVNLTIPKLASGVFASLVSQQANQLFYASFP